MKSDEFEMSTPSSRVTASRRIFNPSIQEVCGVDNTPSFSRIGDLRMRPGPPERHFSELKAKPPTSSVFVRRKKLPPRVSLSPPLELGNRTQRPADRLRTTAAGTRVLATLPTEDGSRRRFATLNDNAKLSMMPAPTLEDPEPSPI